MFYKSNEVSARDVVLVVSVSRQSQGAFSQRVGLVLVSMKIEWKLGTSLSRLGTGRQMSRSHYGPQRLTYIPGT